MALRQKAKHNVVHVSIKGDYAYIHTEIFSHITGNKKTVKHKSLKLQRFELILKVCKTGFT